MPDALSLTTRFPRACFYPDWSLLTWYPTGILDDKKADRVLEFIELREKIDGQSFNRYTDMTGLTKITTGLGHIVRMARQRHRYTGPPVKSAFYAVRLISLTIAGMYAEFMKDSRIHVSIFRDKNDAAAWLGVPRKALLPPKDPPIEHAG
jgi:hypothetical protein